MAVALVEEKRGVDKWSFVSKGKLNLLLNFCQSYRLWVRSFVFFFCLLCKICKHRSIQLKEEYNFEFRAPIYDYYYIIIIIIIFPNLIIAIVGFQILEVLALLELFKVLYTLYELKFILLIINKRGTLYKL